MRGSLLNHVGQLMGEQRPAARRPRCISAAIEDDVGAHGVGHRVDGAGGGRGGLVVMDADLRKSCPNRDSNNTRVPVSSGRPADRSTSWTSGGATAGAPGLAEWRSWPMLSEGDDSR